MTLLISRSTAGMHKVVLPRRMSMHDAKIWLSNKYPNDVVTIIRKL